MADSAAFGPARKSSDHIVAAPRTNEPSAAAQASRPRPAGGLLRPSQVPVPSATTRPTGFLFLAGELAHHDLKALRPSGASTGAAPGPARPSTLPARPNPDVLPGSGQPLTAPVREEMEARLGADFSQVRVHAGSAARASAARVSARAYTVGSHVVIGDGGADKHVLAHELTHVIQQRQGPVAGTGHGSGLKVSDPSDRDERAAEANAVRVMGALPTEHRLAAAAPRQLADEARAAALPTIRQIAKSSTDINRAQGAPVVQRVVDYTGPTIGVEQEITSGHKVVIPGENARKGPIGVVKKAGKELVEFTADMGGGSSGVYTIELKTTPATKGADTGPPQEILDRLAATGVMVGAIQRASAQGAPVVSGTYGEYTIEIMKPDHHISLAVDQVTSNDPGGKQVTFSNQASMGVKTSDLGISGNLDKNPEAALILKSASWFKPDLESQLDSPGLKNAQQAKAVYALVASAIEKLHDIVTSSGKIDVVDEEIQGGGLHHPTIKDSWDVLPRTPVWDWIKPLTQQDQNLVKEKLRLTYGKGPEVAAYRYIVSGQDLAGHKVPESTIGNEQASVFEFRKAPFALKPYLYWPSGREWELPVDLLAREQHQVEELDRNKAQFSQGEQRLIEELASRKQNTTDEISTDVAIAAFFMKRERQELSKDEEEPGSADEWDD